MCVRGLIYSYIAGRGANNNNNNNAGSGGKRSSDGGGSNRRDTNTHTAVENGLGIVNVEKRISVR